MSQDEISAYSHIVQVTPTGFQITITHVGTQGPAGGGVPTGGSTGQVLAKASNDNLDTVWVTPNPGDMQKAVYDTDNDGKVNAASVADTVPWSGVTDKPSTYTPSAHKSSHATGGGDALSPSDIGAAAASHDHSGMYAPLGHTHNDLYYTESEVDARFNTSTGHDHDGTDSKKITWTNIDGKPSTYTPATHDNAAHSAYYITASSVNFANLNANGSVGTGDLQVAIGNHNHDSVYATIGHDHSGIYAPASHTHDGRYYTTLEVDARFNTITGHDHDGTDSKKIEWANIEGKPSTYAPSTHGNAAHSEAYITASSVSFATLNANGSVGTGASQVAVGNHTHEVDILSLTLATGY